MYIYKVAKQFNVSGYTIYEWCLDNKMCYTVNGEIISTNPDYLTVEENNKIYLSQLAISLLEACEIK